METFIFLPEYELASFSIQWVPTFVEPEERSLRITCIKAQALLIGGVVDCETVDPYVNVKLLIDWREILNFLIDFKPGISEKLSGCINFPDSESLVCAARDELIDSLHISHV